MKVGFIGLGIMGSRMAANLLKKGHELVVHNRTRSKADPIISAGAVWVDTPREVGERVNVLFTMLSKPDAVAEVALLGKHAFLSQMPKGSIWVDCSTVNPSFSKLMAVEARERGIRFIDAPVAGSKVPAEQGQLIFLVGGDKKDVDEVRPLLDAMGKAVFHMGGHGMGSGMKMVNNIMLGQAMAAMSEAITLGHSLGISKEKMFEVFASSPVTAPFLLTKKAKIIEGKYDTEFPLRWMHKDLQLAAETAYEAGVAMPVLNVTKEIFALALKNGWGDDDFSAIFKIFGAA